MASLPRTILSDDVLTEGSFVASAGSTITVDSGSEIIAFMLTREVVPRDSFVHWIPRWMDAYYNEESFLRKFFIVLVERTSEVPHFAIYHTKPSFHGILGVPRLAFILEFNQLLSYQPGITISSSDPNAVTGEVRQVKTLGDFLYERKEPIAYRDEENLLLRNFCTVEFTEKVSTGTIDLSSEFSSHPILEDSVIVLTNEYGDVSFIDQTSPEFRTTYVVAPEGVFSVRYTSKTLKDNVNDSIYVTVGSERVKARPYDLHNVWDEYGFLYGISRKPDETNRALKARCQHLSIVSDEWNQGVSAALHQSQVAYWNSTDGNLTLSGSGFYDVTVWGFDEFEYVSEEPTKTETNTYLLSRVPAGDYVQLFYKGTSVDPKDYSVSGSIITITDQKIIDELENSGTLQANYKINNYTVNKTGDFVSSLEPTSLPPQLLTVVGTRNVLAKNATKSIKEWRWNLYTDARNSTAEFE